MNASARVRCCVPGCRRSYRADRCSGVTEIVCGRCFKLADKKLRDRWSQLRRRERAVDRLFNRMPSLRPQLLTPSRRGRGFYRSADFLEAIFNRALNKASAAVIADAQIKLALGADGAPRRKRAA
jgi:hypothetical protein